MSKLRFLLVTGMTEAVTSHRRMPSPESRLLVTVLCITNFKSPPPNIYYVGSNFSGFPSDYRLLRKGEGAEIPGLDKGWDQGCFLTLSPQ